MWDYTGELSAYQEWLNQITRHMAKSAKTIDEIMMWNCQRLSGVGQPTVAHEINQSDVVHGGFMTTQHDTTTAELPADKLLNVLAESIGHEPMVSQKETLHVLVQVLSEEGIVPAEDQECIIMRVVLLADTRWKARESETARAASAPGEQPQSEGQHSGQSSGGLPPGIDIGSSSTKFEHQFSAGYSTSQMDIDQPGGVTGVSTEESIEEE